MEVTPGHWMAQQQQAGRWLCLMLEGDSEACHSLLATRTVSQYCNLYSGTVMGDLAANGPLILLLDHASEPELVRLLQQPELNWGWLGSLPDEDLSSVIRHWRERLLVGPAGSQALYRFHDNRTFARALAHLPTQEWPAMLGPLISVCYWHDQRWNCGNNPAPGEHTVPDPAPWLDVPNPQSGAILQSNILRYLLAEHSEDLCRLAEYQDPKIWLAQVLEQARDWQWEAPEQLEFLVVQRLLETSGEAVIQWQPVPGELAADHFQRMLEQRRRAQGASRDA
ncbi:DUF4123 domain-containing protein [Pseudomonas fluorescens]|uniref:DUF4123 domain-containing protein n=1 Tax=Pseudomonas fluorescens TaxID=294 RepID=UPI001BEAAA55|nr:DUF4123 domain-containing protein [Pseudomonas fluorescens]MBT2375295.1 DUF4123 domain-containing protein [Pseudomonas fluorescens]